MLSRSLALLAFAPTALSKRVRIVSYNIHAWRDAEHADNLERLSSLLAGLAPDVVCLNEVLHPYVCTAAVDPATLLALNSPLASLLFFPGRLPPPLC